MIELLVKENAIINEAQYPKISTPDNSKGYSYVRLYNAARYIINDMKWLKNYD
jgi:hypothetical protein